MIAFGRIDDLGRAYDAALIEWGASGAGDACERGAMMCNFRHDHRVSLARASHFDATSGRPRSGAALKSALDTYFLNHVRRPRGPGDVWKPPDFLEDTLNGDNMLKECNRDIELGTVLDLNRLNGPLQWARSEGITGFKDYPDKGSSPRQRQEWLAERLGAERERGDWIGRILAVAHKSSDARSLLRPPFHPTWCTLWENLEPHLGGPADEWAGVLGVSLNHEVDAQGVVPHWLIVLRYRVGDAGVLCRPTLLDVGWSPYHFPSPPSLPPVEGGRAMDIRPTPHGALTLPEFIHAQIPLAPRYWTAAGSQCQATSGRAPANVCELRQRHHDLLAAEHGADFIRSWMPHAH